MQKSCNISHLLMLHNPSIFVMETHCCAGPSSGQMASETC